MNEGDFPALYQSADDLSLESQKAFLDALRLHLVLLVLAAVLSVLNIPHWSAAILQALVLLGAMSCAIYLAMKRPERYWYAGRAVAESIKTITWRFMCRAEPFQNQDDKISSSEFLQKLKAIVEQNTDVAKELTKHLAGMQITDTMAANRALDLEERKRLYADHRIANQLKWYAEKARHNKSRTKLFFRVLIGINALAVVIALFRIQFPGSPFWPTDILVTLAASLLSWMQARRFSELSASYALAAHEIGLIRMQSMSSTSDRDFSGFVGDTENAFSREHTQWVARQDV